MYILLCLSKKCNLKCSGCSANRTNTLMTIDDVPTIVATLSKLSDDNQISNIVFHGCETFVCDPVVLEELLSWITINLSSVKISCQTNATLVREDNKIFQIMKKYNVALSTSYRGTKELFNKVTNVESSYDEFVEGLKVLQNYMLNKTGTILYIPTELEDEFLDNYKEIIDDCIRLNIKRLKVNEFDSDNPNKRYTEFIIKCMEYIISKKYNIEFSPVLDILKTIHGQYKLECTWRHNCNKFVSIEPDGTLQGCNRGYKLFRPIYKECFKCPIYGWCKGGCESIRENNNGEFPYCSQRIELFDYVLKNRKKLYSYYNVFCNKNI